MHIHAHAAPSAKAPLQPFDYEADISGAFDAEIEISHCGVCHSDLHLIDNDWHTSNYPMVPGHEIIGTVRSVGAGGDASLVGKRVGVGWQRSSCLSCEWCLQGHEELCAQQDATCVDHYGGFAERIIVDSRFVHVIPDALSSENAAPLLCAGITVYSPLSRYVKASSRVGIIGIGGLGHLAVQFASKMGCDVTAFSTTDAKKEEAQQLGAQHFVNSRDVDSMKKQRHSLDLIINTAPFNMDYTPFLRALRPNGVLCFVAAPSEPVMVQVGRLFDNQAIAGSSIGSRQGIRSMLAFAARHGIRAWTETLPMDAVNTALDRLRQNDVRYRFVLER